MSRREDAQAGFTLMELIVTMVLMGTLATFVAMFMWYDVNMYQKVVRNTDGLQSSRMALQRMASDIRQIVSRDSIVTATSSALKFDNTSDSLVYYLYASGELRKNSYTFLKDVSGFQFTYYDESGTAISSPVSDFSQISTIKISLTTNKNEKVVSLDTTIRPRNFR
jgi:prepilin-type N-terminal cleavage/methylation domain-containing protein